LGVFVVTLWVQVPATWHSSFPTGGDELGFARTASELVLAYGRCLRFEAGAWSDPIWSDDLDNYGAPNPRVGVYVVGLVGLSVERAVPQHHRFTATRITMNVMMALCVVLAAWLAASLSSPCAGLTATALLLVHPVVRASKAVILPEIPLLLFSLLALLALVKGLGARRGGQARFWLLVMAGLCVGLAIACKLYAVALLPVFALALAMGARRLGFSGLAAGALGLLLGAAAFVFTNPLLVVDPLGGLRAMSSGHLSVLGGSSQPLGGGLEQVSLMLRWSLELWGPIAPPLEELIKHPEPSWVHPGALLVTLGLFGALLRRQVVPVAWLLCTLALVGWVVSRLPLDWLVVKTCLLPSVAIVLVCSCADPLVLARALRDRFRPAHPAPGRPGSVR